MSNSTISATKFAAVTANDSVNLAVGVRAVYVGVSGDVRVTGIDMDDGTYETLTNLASGMWHPMQVKRIWSTGTTATGIVAGF